MGVVRFTKQRQAILDVVQGTDVHPDASWVYAQVKQVLPNISLGTVYRSLEALADDGYLVKIHSAGDVTRYDARKEDHHHAVCKCCGKIMDVFSPNVRELKKALASLPAGFELQEVRLEFHGICPECTRRRTQS
ncbi:Fur family transcriptional regulator [Deinococcus misasensis]|uniref:Fur family transcriptional regulator n=1 Tax=Deinococcus misasensis TaxID=392413 RepID=UPI00055270D9|nr:transcriptional repressor [Deinococcus misasensis]